MTTKEIWNLYHDDVKQFIFFKVKNKQAADDLLQEVFIKVHVKLSSLKDLKKLKPWIFVIAKNIVNDYYKLSSRYVTTEMVDFSFKETAIEHNEKDCLPGLIKKLPKKYRIPLFMSDIKGLKQKDVAESLQLPLATVKSQIQRARKLLAEAYMECCDYKRNADGFLVGEAKGKSDCKICN